MPRKRGKKKRPRPKQSPRRASGGKTSARGEALFQQAMQLHQAGRFAEAEPLYRALLEHDPKHVNGLHLFGLMCYQGKLYEPAEELISKAIALHPGEASFWGNLGAVQHERENYEAAEASLQKALALDPALAGAQYNLGRALAAQGRFSEAEGCYRVALAVDRKDFEAANNLGNLLLKTDKLQEAESFLRQAIAVNPDYAPAYSNLGNILIVQGESQEAIALCEQALQRKPDFAEALHNLGNAHALQDRFPEAFQAYNRALQLAPDMEEIYTNFGHLLVDHFEYAAAADLLLKMEKRGLIGASSGACLIHSWQQICVWEGIPERVNALMEAVRRERAIVSPFIFLCLDTSPQDQLLSQAVYAEKKLSGCPRHDLWKEGPAAVATDSQKIRIGFVSNDFRRHVAGYLISDLVECLDRERFEVYGYSFGRNDESDVRKRLEQGFDRIVEIKDDSYEEAAEKIRDDGIHILLDIKGYTIGTRAEIFAFSPAPLQVRWLGHAGSMGADCYNYLLVDSFSVPISQQCNFSETLVHLPDSYQVCVRKLTDSALTREDCGLPAEGLVLGCFNSPYKITPDVFAVWMQLLKEVPESVFWLIESNPAMVTNLRREAEAQGVSGERLIFSNFADQEKHLHRYRYLDLFLDTRIVSACATCADALWGGCPVLTCVGDTYSSRAAGSMLRAAGFPELITHDMASYEEQALALARDPERLRTYRSRIEAVHQTAPLFDIARFTRHFQSALEEMWRKHVAGEGPRPFAVLPEGGTRDYGVDQYQRPPEELVFKVSG